MNQTNMLTVTGIKKKERKKRRMLPIKQLD